MAYLEAVREIVALLNEVDWEGLDANVVVRALDQTVDPVLDPSNANNQDDVRDYQPAPFIVVGKLEGSDLVTYDGWLPFSKQTIRITPLSVIRSEVSHMQQLIFGKINNYVGRPRSDGGLIQRCVITDTVDIYEEESSYYGLDMVFDVAISN